MRSAATSRPFTINLLGILFLAFAVFGWGLQYKLSLYDSPGSIAASTPHAKLLSQKERPAVARDAALARPEIFEGESQIYGLASLFFLISLVLHLVELLRSLGLPSDAVEQQLRIVASSFFSFRPPPALVPAN